MTKKIVRSISTVAIFVLVSSVLMIFGVMYRYFTNAQLAQLKIEAQMLGESIDLYGVEYLENLKIDRYRITLIESSGKVIYDTHYNIDDMENHLEREEIKNALKNGSGESRRYSDTLMESYVYYAQRIKNGQIIRLSLAQSSIFTLILDMVEPIIIIMLLSFMVSIILAKSLSKSIVEPLNDLNLEHPLENDVYEELAILLRRIDSQQKQLKQQKNELQKKTDEFDAVVGSMNEGLILLNSKLNIISINHAASAILGIQGVADGKDILTVCRNLTLQDILASSQKGERVEKNMDIHGNIYQIAASPIFFKKQVAGIALLFFDITEKEKAEVMRREFTANVSHELKTPLHSIAGYSELMANNMVKAEDYVGFSKKIHKEARRMVQLVEDIIRLSQLDEGASNMESENVNLYELTKGVVQSLETEADYMNVDISLNGHEVYINGVHQLLYGIVYNICENAIKYNQVNGKVDITLDDNEREVVLTIKDTGIGIPLEDQSRIFERFYRVDKSRSKEVGGTGLGLSIVKHAVKVLNAKIDLESTVGKGTTVTVRFPK